MVSRSNSTCSEKKNLVSLVNTQLIETMFLQLLGMNQFMGSEKKILSESSVNIEELYNQLNSTVSKEHLEEKFYQVETDIALEALKKEQDYNYSKYKVLAKKLNHLKCY